MISEERWTQVSGDVDPLTYGGIFARLDGYAIELLEIQPVADCVGAREAAEVGFPIWLRESYHDPCDLWPEDNADALACVGLDSDASPLDVAIARHAYGYAEPCVGGWASELPYLGNIFDPADLTDCDAEFRADILTD